MIHDSLSNSSLYERMHPRFKQAFDFLKSADALTLPAGRSELEGENLYVTVAVLEGIKPEDSKLEAHKNYIDIQMPLTVTEVMGWSALKNMKTVAREYDAAKDILFFEDKATSYVTVKPFEFVVFFPGDAHQPCIARETIKKIIVKVKI